MFVHRTARPLALVLLVAALTGCEHRSTAPVLNVRPPSALVAKRPLVPESIPTYERSGQVVHPDVVYTPPGVFAHPWHLALTPYPFGRGEYENPSVFASDDGVTWWVEGAVVNPVARPRREVKDELLSDPALLFVPELRELWLYYRSYTPDSDYVWLMRSPDAVSWSASTLLFATRRGRALSPSVVHLPGGPWLMWTVRGRCSEGTDTQVELRRSADGIAWSAPEPAAVDGLAPWHVFVRWVASLGQWVMATNVKSQQGGCVTTQLYLAFSADGLAWRHGRDPWLAAGGDSAGLFATVVYRSAFAEVGDSLRFWYSGAFTTYSESRCEGGKAVCADSSRHWSPLGGEIRLATDILPR